MSYLALTLKRYFLFGTFLDETSLSGKYNEKSLLPLISYMILFAVISSKYGTSMIAISEFLSTYRQQSLNLRRNSTYFLLSHKHILNEDHWTLIDRRQVQLALLG